MATRAFAQLGLGLRALARAWRSSLRDAYSEEELRRRFPRVVFGRGVTVTRMDRFRPGRHVHIHDRAHLQCAGAQWSGGRGFITMGDNCEIGPDCTIWGAGGVTFGANVHVGDHTTIASHTAAQIKPDDDDVWKPLDIEYGAVVIGSHVIIGTHVVIAPGVHVGDHAMVGANSLVRTDVPANCFYAGSPAHFIRELRPGETARLRNAYNPLVALDQRRR